LQNVFRNSSFFRRLAIVAACLFLWTFTPWPCAPPANPTLLNQAYKDLYQVTAVLDQAHVKYFLVESSLLFAVREKSLQMWDYNDFDLALDPNDKEKLVALAPVFKEHGYIFRMHRDCGYSVTPEQYTYSWPSLNLLRFFKVHVLFLGRRPPHIDLHCPDGSDQTALIPPEDYAQLQSLPFGPGKLPAPLDPHKQLAAWFGPRYMTPMQPAFMVQCVAVKNSLWMVAVIGMIVAYKLYHRTRSPRSSGDIAFTALRNA
jgi:hypothetical protein